MSRPCCLSLLAIIAGGVLAACAPGDFTIPEMTIPTPAEFTCAVPANREMRFLALGDSYTIGENVEEAERWPVQLVGLLQAGGVSMRDPEIIARTGWTTAELARAIEREDPQGTYDLVTLLIGVNDQYQRRSIEAYRTEFAALLGEAIRLAGGEPGRVVVLSIPDWGVTPFAERVGRADVSADLNTFNAAAQAISEEQGAHTVDITPISREAAADPSLLAEDGLHPSGKMYEAWARLAFGEVCAALTGISGENETH